MFRAGRSANSGDDRSHAPSVRVPPMSVVDADFQVAPGFPVRLAMLGVVAVVAFVVLGLKLWSLELIQSARFRSTAQHQAVRPLRIPGPRGAILDRRGRPLAETEGRMALVVDPRVLGRLGGRGRWHPSRRGRVVLARLARATGIPLRRIVSDVRRTQLRQPWVPVFVVRDARFDLANYVDERHDRFPGVHVEVLPDRQYPQGALGAEFLGLLGEIGPAQLAERRYRGYRPGDVIGQTGVEASYDRFLRGRPTLEQIPVNALGEPVGRARLVRPALPARVLRLTIDARIQRAAVRAIRDGIVFAHANGHTDAGAGAAVVMDARTGALLALASYPSFNQVAVARDRKTYLRLLRSTGPALIDRATQGVYPLGSTFKPIVAEAALSAGLITPTSVVPCTGSLRVGNVVFHNVEPSIHALLTLPQALSISCDTWFYRLGVSFYSRQLATGRLDMQSWAQRLGFGSPTGLDIRGEVGGIVPTPTWLRHTFTDRWARTWYAGTSVNLSIGQGYLTVTPLQLAVAYATLANGGTVVRPHVADAVLNGRGRVLRRLSFRPRRHIGLIEVSTIRQGLYEAAHHGTSASVFADFPIPVAGKTGTAEAPFGSDHSWYASWAPAWKPRVVVVVLIEHGGFGVQAAAPAAREIYRAFFRTGSPTRRG